MADMQPSAVVGLDFSLRSPGICVLMSGGHTHLAGFYGFDPKSYEEYPGVTLHLFRQPAEEKVVTGKKRSGKKKARAKAGDGQQVRRVVADLRRYSRVIDRVVELLTGIFPDAASRSVVHVAIESYAFYGRGHTGNNYKLHEVTGCCKLRLFREGFTSWSEVPASSWRKLCFGTSRAEKKDAYDLVLRAFPGLDLLTPCRRKLGQGGSAVPCPVQDMCEAYCIALAYQKGSTTRTEAVTTTGRKKRKRKEKPSLPGDP